MKNSLDSNSDEVDVPLLVTQHHCGTTSLQHSSMCWQWPFWPNGNTNHKNNDMGDNISLTFSRLHCLKFFYCRLLVAQAANFGHKAPQCDSVAPAIVDFGTWKDTFCPQKLQLLLLRINQMMILIEFVFLLLSNFEGYQTPWWPMRAASGGEIWV
jgi:hypothetical protein